MDFSRSIFKKYKFNKRGDITILKCKGENKEGTENFRQNFGLEAKGK